MTLTPEQREALQAVLNECADQDGLTRRDAIFAAGMRYAYEDAARTAESYADCPHAWIPLKHKIAESVRSRIPKDSALAQRDVPREPTEQDMASGRAIHE